MSDKKFEGIDWNRNGKRDMGDRCIEMKIVEKIHEEEEKMRNNSNTDNSNNNVDYSGCAGDGCLIMLVGAFVFVLLGLFI